MIMHFIIEYFDKAQLTGKYLMAICSTGDLTSLVYFLWTLEGMLNKDWLSL